MMSNYENMSKLSPTPERLEFATHLIMKRGNKCDYCAGKTITGCRDFFGNCETGIKEWLISEAKNETDTEA